MDSEDISASNRVVDQRGCLSIWLKSLGLRAFGLAQWPCNIVAQAGVVCALCYKKPRFRHFQLANNRILNMSPSVLPQLLFFFLPEFQIQLSCPVNRPMFITIGIWSHQPLERNFFSRLLLGLT